MTPPTVVVHLRPGPAEHPVEVVERKGLGHPDTLADALAERMSVAYSRQCLQRFGAVLHHNLDKLYLRGGHARTELGSFEMLAPATLTIGGRVSTTFADSAIDHRELFERVACDYLTAVLPRFDHARWLRIEHATTNRSRYRTWFQPRTLDDLPEIAHPTASDTVAVTAWWPHTPTENAVLSLERYLNQHGDGPRYSHLGQDIKVMARRHGETVDIIVNVAVDPRHAVTKEHYDDALGRLRPELEAVAGSALGERLRHRLSLNTSGDNPHRGKRQYLLGSGSCLEFGEEGFVGRGNSASGLIAVHRPKSVEAPFGKNPTYHAGKVYTLYAEQIARSVHAATGVAATVAIVAQHSAALREPALVEVALHAPANESVVMAAVSAVLERTDHVALAVDDGRLIPY